MNSIWYKKAKVKLLGTSQSPTFEAAMAEWHFTDEVEVHPQSDQVCELCGKKHLQYRFKILNVLNGNVLLVGSSCIRKFPGIEILDDLGNLITDEGARKMHLERRERALRKKHAALQPLRELYAAERNHPDKRQAILSAVEQYETSGRWPYGIVHLQVRMDAIGIKYDRSCYR